MTADFAFAILTRLVPAARGAATRTAPERDRSRTARRADAVA